MKPCLRTFSSAVLVLVAVSSMGCARGVPPEMAWQDHYKVQFLMRERENQQEELTKLKDHAMMLETSLAQGMYVMTTGANCLEDQAKELFVLKKRIEALEAQLKELESKSPTPNPLQGRK